MVVLRHRGHCPQCGSDRTFRRHGVHFEHMLRCAECHFCYDPDHFGKDALLVLNRLHEKLSKKINSPEYDQVCQALARFGVEAQTVAGRDGEPSLRFSDINEFLQFLQNRVD